MTRTLALLVAALALPAALGAQIIRPGTVGGPMVCNPNLPEPPPEGCGGIALVTESGLRAPWGGGVPQTEVTHYYFCNSQGYTPAGDKLHLGSSICKCSQSQRTCPANACEVVPTSTLRHCPDTCPVDGLLPIDHAIDVATFPDGVELTLHICYFVRTFSTVPPELLVRVAGPSGAWPETVIRNLSGNPVCPDPSRGDRVATWVSPRLPPGAYDLQLSLYNVGCPLDADRFVSGETENWQFGIGSQLTVLDPVHYIYP